MNKTQEKNYVDSKGVRCPYCGSDELEGQFVETNAGTAQQDMHCIDCEESWTDTYTLNGADNFIDKIKIVISVSGGVVQAVMSNSQNVEVTIYDFDNDPVGDHDNLYDLVKSIAARDARFRELEETLNQLNPSYE